MEEFLLVHDVAKRIGVTPARIRDLERKGELPAIRTPDGTRIFRADDVEDLARERAVRKEQAGR